ncbi:hypothetical protein TREMEDRAFT_65797 [Tremella mesenterica DSM 1558]|uniref:uncharacterized protein n=1 Tax=Tremella mesenterica (strain ATCC 24925 / CBS 8224 / DSM 1558 / NBRC 9311 / NRRL Y-6157 / RJB 2259-6 / UBC 559-6) TaxID=578456 RepID=UPI00032C2AAE|nr:uncharacterized protein TREMEDRAFT_65797 [Tremella mesenterica DSM 1558]EIW66191.1 hypothetical protein TREMEDRAFT_65797 [Tremella mesenterica DSM 1558]
MALREGYDAIPLEEQRSASSEETQVPTHWVGDGSIRPAQSARELTDAFNDTLHHGNSQEELLGAPSTSETVSQLDFMQIMRQGRDAVTNINSELKVQKEDNSGTLFCVAITGLMSVALTIMGAILIVRTDSIADAIKHLQSSINGTNIHRRTLGADMEHILDPERLSTSSLGHLGKDVDNMLSVLVWDSERQEGILTQVTREQTDLDMGQNVAMTSEGCTQSSIKWLVSENQRGGIEGGCTMINPSLMSEILLDAEEGPIWMLVDGQVTKGTLKPIAPFGRGSPTGEQDSMLKVGEKWYTLKEEPSDGGAVGEINE